MYCKNEHFEGLGLSCNVKALSQAQISMRDNNSVVTCHIYHSVHTSQRPENTSKDIYSACLVHFYTNLMHSAPGSHSFSVLEVEISALTACIAEGCSHIKALPASYVLYANYHS